jgi:hypothetical protein
MLRSRKYLLPLPSLHPPESFQLQDHPLTLPHLHVLLRRAQAELLFKSQCAMEPVAARELINSDSVPCVPPKLNNLLKLTKADRNIRLNAIGTRHSHKNFLLQRQEKGNIKYMIRARGKLKPTPIHFWCAKPFSRPRQPYPNATRRTSHL